MRDDEPLALAQRAIVDIDSFVKTDRDAGRPLTISQLLITSVLRAVFGLVKWAESAEERLAALEQKAKLR